MNVSLRSWPERKVHWLVVEPTLDISLHKMLQCSAQGENFPSLFRGLQSLNTKPCTGAYSTDLLHTMLPECLGRGWLSATGHPALKQLGRGCCEGP